MPVRALQLAWLFSCALVLHPSAQTPVAFPKPPIVNDPALKIELIATIPEVEACTTVCGDPDGAVYVGNDPRDGRLNTKEPVCTIVRFDKAGPDRKRTVFADKLYSPAGSAWHDGWLYVIHDPLMSRFKDTDGDGVADVREDLVTNLGLTPYEGLNDHVVSGFTLGMDGFWYISVGDRGIYQAKSAKDGSTITMQGGGIVRCRTDGSQLEIFSTGTRNHLSVNLDAEDNAFTRDNTDDGNGWWTRLTHHIEGGYYGYPYDYRKSSNYGVMQPSEQTLSAIKQHGVDDSGTSGIRESGSSEGAPSNVSKSGNPEIPKSRNDFLPAMADFGGGSPTGGFCYLSDGLPEQYRGKHFFAEWGKSGIFVTEAARDGATFKLVSDTKLVEAAKGGEFRPMQISVAADGSVLIADWGYGGWKSPKVAGAVWRLSWPEAKPAPQLKDESKANAEELIAALGHPDRDQRLRVQTEVMKRVIANYTEPFRKWEELTTPFYERWRADREAKDPNVVSDGEMSWAQEELWWGDRAKFDHSLSERSIKVFGRPMAEAIQRSRRDAETHVAALFDPLRAAAASRHSPTLVRLHALQTFAQLQNVRLLQTPNCGLAEQVFARDTEAVFALAAIDEITQVREHAVRGLASAPLGADSHISFSARWMPLLLHDDDPSVRLAAVRLLGKLDDEGIARAVIQQLDDVDPQVRFASVAALRKQVVRSMTLTSPLRGEAQEIRDALQSTNLAIRDGSWRALEGIAEMEHGSNAVALISTFNTAPDLRVRIYAVATLGRIAYKPKPYDGHWWATQPVKTPPPPKSVAWEGTPKALQALTAALTDSDNAVRVAAAEAFTQFVLDESGKNAAATLRARLAAETDPAVRRQLIEALGVQRDPEAMNVFTAIVLDERADLEFRKIALRAIVNTGGEEAKKAIARLAEIDLSTPVMLQVIDAAGGLKAAAVASTLVARLAHPDAALRAAAAKALGAIGSKTWPAEATTALIGALSDQESKVQLEAINTLGAAQVRQAIPPIIALLQRNKFRKEALTALAAMPTPETVPLLTAALNDKDSGTRRGILKALKTLREQAWPLIEQKLLAGEIASEFEPEIRKSFQSGAITKWKMIGHFENVWEAVHPPEKDALANGGAPDLLKKYLDAEGQEAGWRDVTADTEQGRVNLAQVFQSTGMVCAYAYVEIESADAADARLLTGSDDQIAVWLNGSKILDVSATRGFEPDKDELPIHLAAGRNRLLVKIGNVGGGWEFAARMPGLEGARFVSSKQPAPEEKQRAFALAKKPDGTWLRPGDAARGERLFFDPTTALGGICATCHVVNGKGRLVGPDLTTVATNYQRADLITSLLEPSKTIALGFEQVMLETKSDETMAGVLRNEAGDSLTIVSADGQSHIVPKTEIKTRTAIPLSLMPPGQTLGLKPEEFTDLVAYLETLRSR